MKLVTFFCVVAAVLLDAEERPEPVYREKPARYWLARMDAKNAAQRLEAVEALEALWRKAGEPAIRALVKALSDPDAEVRLAAVEALSGADSWATLATPAFRRLLSEEQNLRVRRTVARTVYEWSCLGRTPTIPLAPALLRALEKDADQTVRGFAASTLGGLGACADTSVPALAKALRDPVTRVRECAANALGELGPKASGAVTALLAVLESDARRSVRHAAVYALGRIGPAATAAVPALTALVATKGKGTSSTRYAALNALGGMGPVARGSIPAILTALADESRDVRWSVPGALVKIGEKGNGVVPVLLRALEDEVDSMVRGSLAYALAKLAPDDEQVVAALVTAATRDERPVELRQVLRLLEEMGPKGREAAQVLRERTSRRTPRTKARIARLPGVTLERGIAAGNLSTVQRVIEKSPALVNLPLTRRGLPPLTLAVGKGDAAVVAYLLKQGADANLVDPRLEMPVLHIALGKPSLLADAWDGPGMARALLEHGADVNARDEWGDTPLHVAAEHQNPETVLVLLDRGAKIEAADTYGDTALHNAAQHDKIQIVAILLKRGADPNAENRKGETPVHEAARYASLDSLKILVNEGGDISKRTATGATVLELAAAPLRRGFGDQPSMTEEVKRRRTAFAMVEFLLGKGADPCDRGSSGCTALHAAARAGSTKVVELLLDHGAPANIEDDSGRTPLFVARHWKREDTAASLEKRGGKNLLAYEPEAVEAFFKALDTGNVDAVTRALKETPSLSNARNRRGETALQHITQEGGRADIVKLLVFHGAEVNVARDGMFRATPLHNAAMGGDRAVIDLLLEGGARLEARDDRGATPLLCATSWETIVYLVDRGARADVTTEAGESILHRAAESGDEKTIRWVLQRAKGLNLDTPGDRGIPPILLAILASVPGPRAVPGGAQDRLLGCVKVLLEHGANPNVHGGEPGFSPIHLAAGSGFLPLAEFLIEKGAKATARDAAGNTVWHYVVLGGRTAAAAFLSEHGADVNATNTAGQTPLHVCAEKKDATVAKVLLKYGAKIDVRDASGRTPLYAAAERKAWEVAKLLLEGGADPEIRSAGGLSPADLMARDPQGRKVLNGADNR